ncbi:MAG: putative pterin-4-alpha-carbinolamine dehydratase [Steroidobacteraceae bacterium]|nr:putative pterin-4-alpha-carbinolamine dehydratase [Steroidobacteraceae bacterium]
MTAPRALARAEAERLMASLHGGWQLAADGRSIRREFAFRDFFHTMSFVNALAHIANVEDHHPDLAVGYSYCRVTFTTHSAGGLTGKDFDLALKADRIPLG